MRRPVILCVLLVLMFLSAILTPAQDNPPPSLCTDGTWYCPDSDNPHREAWNWTCGWYWGHHYAGLLAMGDMPETCNPEGPYVSPGCYDFAGLNDVYYYGPLNQPGNAHMYSGSADGTCSGGVGLMGIWVRTALTVPATVVTYCNSFGGPGYTASLNMSTWGGQKGGVPVPSDIWLCY